MLMTALNVWPFCLCDLAQKTVPGVLTRQRGRSPLCRCVHACMHSPYVLKKGQVCLGPGAVGKNLAVFGHRFGAKCLLEEP